jgi:hypothetical protein
MGWRLTSLAYANGHSRTPQFQGSLRQNGTLARHAFAPSSKTFRGIYQILSIFLSIDGYRTDTIAHTGFRAGGSKQTGYRA